MPKEIQIYLDQINYFPGEVITGKVACNFDGERKIQEILVKFKGICLTSWTENESHYSHHSKTRSITNVTSNGQELYFEQEFNISGQNGLTLIRGEHVFPFSYQLPITIPSSYEDKSNEANVRYSIKATIIRSWKFNIESFAMFNVISPLDLNTIPRIREPVQRSVDKTLCSCSPDDQCVTFTYNLQTAVFIPGQDVKISVHVVNLTNNVIRINFKITKLTEYIATYPLRKTKRKHEIIAELCDKECVHGEKSWEHILNLPLSTAFPNMCDCSLINITYRLKGTVEIPYPHTNLSADVPLFIGNIPLIKEHKNANLLPTSQAPPLDSVSLATFENDSNHVVVHTNPSGECAVSHSNEDVIKTKV